MSEKIPKRKDSTREEVRGWVPQQTARKFKAMCMEQGKDFSDGLEVALLKVIEAWSEQDIYHKD